MRIRVLIVDDHAVVREGTREILERDPALQVIGEAEDGRQAIALAAVLRPDVVVMDLALPGVSGIEAARQIRAVHPDTNILVLSAYDDEDYVDAVVRLGAAGYLLKTAHGNEIVSAIHSICRGEIVLHPRIAAKLVGSLRGGKQRGVVEGQSVLSEREMEILRLVAKGLRNKEIARELGLSVRTVEGHLGQVLVKLGVSSRSEAIVYGASRHWFSFD